MWPIFPHWLQDNWSCIDYVALCISYSIWITFGLHVYYQMEHFGQGIKRHVRRGKNDCVTTFVEETTLVRFKTLFHAHDNVFVLLGCII